MNAIFILNINNISHDFLKKIIDQKKDQQYFILIYSPSEVSTSFLYNLLNLDVFYKILSVEAINNENINSLLIEIEKKLKIQYAINFQKNEYKKKNNFLENINKNLENLVESRTSHLILSNSDMSQRLDKERKILKFVKDFSNIASIYEALNLLKKNLFSFSKVHPPLFLIQYFDKRTDVYVFNKDNYSIKSSVLNINESEFNNVHEFNFDKTTLANLIGRPVQKYIKFKIDTPTSNIANRTPLKAYILIENSLHDNELNDLNDYFLDRISLLSSVLDNLILKDILFTETFRWEMTFDGVEDSLAIIDEQFNLIRSNKSFGNNKKNKCFQVFAKANSPCDKCPIIGNKNKEIHFESEITIGNNYFTVQSNLLNLNESSSNHNFINRYENRTEHKKLYIKFIQSQKISAIGVLAGNIAHELNNPLTGISSLVQVIKQETQNLALISDLNEIEKAAIRSQRIIKNLISFSNTEGSGMEEISFRITLNDTLPMLKAVMRNFSVEIYLTNDSDMIMVDVSLLQQVLFNLINNACQAMGKTGKLILKSQVVNNFLKFDVIDNGPGIALEIQKHIFEPFYTTKQEGLGTGLGLSLSKSIISKFGGQLLLKSKEGIGSEFSILLPISRK